MVAQGWRALDHGWRCRPGDMNGLLHQDGRLLILGWPWRIAWTGGIDWPVQPEPARPSLTSQLDKSDLGNPLPPADRESLTL